MFGVLGGVAREFLSDQMKSVIMRDPPSRATNRRIDMTGRDRPGLPDVGKWQPTTDREGQSFTRVSRACCRYRRSSANHGA